MGLDFGGGLTVFGCIFLSGRSWVWVQLALGYVRIGKYDDMALEFVTILGGHVGFIFRPFGVTLSVTWRRNY